MDDGEAGASGPDLALIRGALGATDLPNLRYVDAGWDSRAYVLDGGAIVFKVARTPAASAQYRHEVAVLRRLEQLDLPVQVPRVRWVDAAGRFFGYEGVRGVVLQELEDGWGGQEDVGVGAALGSFARQLHDLEHGDVPDRPVESEIEEWNAKHAMVEPVLRERLDDGERRRVADFFVHELPERLLADHRQPVLCHGDLGPWNVVVGPEGVGVIDFGDTCRADAALDLAGFGDAIGAAMADAYGAGEAVRSCAAMRHLALPVLDLGYYVGKANAAGITACIDQLRAGLLAT